MLGFISASLRRSKDSGRLSFEDCLTRIGNVDWSYDNPHWFGILLQQGDKIIAGTPAMKLASRFIAYLLGDELEEYESKQYETITNLLFNHITYMSEDEIDEFILYCTNIYNL